MKNRNARVLAFYLPQFHPVPENDAWWGKGFTEWTNVGKAKPLFPGHCQPVVPSDLGYYDLRVAETREEQAKLAREYGIEGFVYWHYWFKKDRRLLERPFNEVLASGKPDFPFALAWANESWKGRWHGLMEGKTLIEQEYGGDEDYIAHFYAVLPAFKDPRYITCEGKPVFFIYKPDLMPDPQHFISLWRKLAMENGLPGLCFIAGASIDKSKDSSAAYFDKMMSFGFDMVNNHNFIKSLKLPRWLRLMRTLFFKKVHLLPDIRQYETSIFDGPIDACENVVPSVYSGWDNTPRAGKNGVILYGFSPKTFKQALKSAIDKIRHKPFEKRILMIKSWNEWAEGNYLEPDIRWGRSLLEAIKEVVCESSSPVAEEHTAPKM
jgi:hypothetical protein